MSNWEPPDVMMLVFVSCLPIGVIFMGAYFIIKLLQGC